MIDFAGSFVTSVIC